MIMMKINDDLQLLYEFAANLHFENVVLKIIQTFEMVFFRSIRWLDRCIKAHKKTKTQNLFAIVQGGLDPQLRTACVKGTDQ